MSAPFSNWSPRDVEILGLVFKETLRLREEQPDIRVILASRPHFAETPLAELITAAAIAVRIASEVSASA